MKQRVQSTAKKQGTELEGHWLWGRVATCTFLSFSFLSSLPLFCLSYSNTSSYWIWGAPPLLRYLWRCRQKLEAGKCAWKCATAMPVICPNELQRCGSNVNKQIIRKDGNWEERMRREEEMSGEKKGRKNQGGMKIWKKPENTAIFQRNLYIDLIKLTIFCGSSSRYLKQAAKLERPQPQPQNPLWNKGAGFFLTTYFKSSDVSFYFFLSF